MAQETTQAARFDLGFIVATQGITDLIEDGLVVPSALLRRHQAGDWGDLDPEDRAANNRDLIHGGRLLSAYDVAAGVRVWIITEAEDDNGYRHVTTLLRPDEY